MATMDMDVEEIVLIITLVVVMGVGMLMGMLMLAIMVQVVSVAKERRIAARRAAVLRSVVVG